MYTTGAGSFQISLHDLLHTNTQKCLHKTETSLKQFYNASPIDMTKPASKVV